MLALLLLPMLACDGDTSDTGTPPTDSGTTDTGAAAVETDVLVIGAGPAGLAAAWEALDAGTRVIVLERQAESGGAGWYAGNFFGAATSWQGVLGIEDSVEAAAEDWGLFTGGDAEDPWVQRLLEESGDTLSWLAYEFGIEVLDVYQDPSAGSVPRMHIVSHPEHGASVGPLVEALAEHVWLNSEANSLRIRDGRVAGAVATDLTTGESYALDAEAVVVATGGFARDLDAVLADRPDLQGLTVVFEADLGSDGGGTPLLQQVGAAAQNAGNYGVYVHSIADHRADFPNEALWVPSMSRSLILNTLGERVINEDETRSFHLSHRLSELPDRQLYAAMPADVISSASVMSPAYNWAEAGVVEEFTVDELVEGGAAWVYDSPAELAADWSMDPSVVEATFATYEGHVADGRDPDFNKGQGDLISFGEDPITLFELVPGAAKAFGGAELDLSARVLDTDGQPIPGLFAAGEVAGMLGSAAVGEGFSGSVTACYLTGRVAGQSAAAEVSSPR